MRQCSCGHADKGHDEKGFCLCPCPCTIFEAHKPEGLVDLVSGIELQPSDTDDEGDTIPPYVDVPEGPEGIGFIKKSIAPKGKGNVQ